jgi:hypothetical protein
MITTKKQLTTTTIALIVLIILWLMAVAAVFIRVKEPFGCRQAVSAHTVEIGFETQRYVVDTCVAESNIQQDTIVVARAWRKTAPDNFLNNISEELLIHAGSSNRYYEVGPYRGTVRKCDHYNKDKSLTTSRCDYYNYELYGVVVDEAYVRPWYDNIIARFSSLTFTIVLLFPGIIVLLGIILIVWWWNFKKSKPVK